MKKIALAAILFLTGIFAFSQSGKITADDIRLVFESGKSFDAQGGFHLYVRKKRGIESVMLTETTKDPSGKSDNYAYRALEFNPVNGNEKRMLDGKFLESDSAKFPLMDSSAEADSVFGEAFHIFIPSVIAFGYEWTRHGQIKIGRGTFINIRAFEKKYGDYSGRFYDNPFMFDLGSPVGKKHDGQAQNAKIVLTDDYNPDAAKTFSDVAAFNGGEICYSKGTETIVSDITASLDRIKTTEKADVVFAIDATGSMKDDIQTLREEWIPRLMMSFEKIKSLRIALLLYRDYGDTFKLMGLPVKRFEFTDRIESFNRDLNSFKIYGNEGGDIPEAVYEALYAGLTFYNWRKDAERKIILIGDAPAHPVPKGTGRYTKKLVEQTAIAKNVKIDTIIIPDDKTRRGR